MEQGEKVLLHLSDLHFGLGESPTDVASRKMVLDSLLDSLKNLGYIPNIVCITGDIIYQGKSEAYQDAADWLTGLLKRFQLSSSNLICCPGNHELNIRFKLPSALNAKDADDQLTFPFSDAMIKPFEDYISFCNKLEIPLLELGNASQNYLVGKRSVDYIDFYIFNSAWFCQGNSNENGNLWLGQNFLTQLRSYNDLKKDHKRKIVVTLMHHPERNLHEDEIRYPTAQEHRPAVFLQIAECSNIILTGHSHGGAGSNKTINGAHYFEGGATYHSAGHNNAVSIFIISEARFEKIDIFYTPNQHEWQCRPADRYVFNEFPEVASKTNNLNISPIDGLIKLGWNIKNSNGYLFEASYRPIPSMQESKKFFDEIKTSFSICFQTVNSLEGLHLIANNPRCTGITISACKFTDLSELSDFKYITSLEISQVPFGTVGNVDTSPISHLTNLTNLTLSGVQTTNISTFSNLKKLTNLTLCNSPIIDISAISEMKQLKEFDIHGTRVTDLSPLSNSDNLKTLVIGGSQVNDLVKLSHLKELCKLTLIDQGQTNLAPISTLTRLKDLTLLGPREIDISTFTTLTKLENLHIGGLKFRELTPFQGSDVIENMTSLKTLILSQIAIGDSLCLDRLKHLENINFFLLPLTSIEFLRPVKSLKTIYFCEINVSDISPFLDLPNLTKGTFVRVPARADIINELQRRGIQIEYW